MNARGIRGSARFQKLATFGLLAIFACFTALGFLRGDPANALPLFARPGAGLSILLALQVVPYFLTGFESVSRSRRRRARPRPALFGRASARRRRGAFFYVAVIGAVAFVFPWKTLAQGHLGTEAAFRRAFGSDAIARAIVFAAFLSLLKIFNGNFVAASRLLLGIGRRNLVHPALGRVDRRHGTPVPAIVFMALFTAGASLLGDALLVPVTEVGSLAVGVGWGTACLAAARRLPAARRAAFAGAAVSAAIVLMKIVPAVPGSFTAPSGSRSRHGRRSGPLLGGTAATNDALTAHGRCARAAGREGSDVSAWVAAGAFSRTAAGFPEGERRSRRA